MEPYLWIIFVHIEIVLILLLVSTMFIKSLFTNRKIKSTDSIIRKIFKKLMLILATCLTLCFLFWYIKFFDVVDVDWGILLFFLLILGIIIYDLIEQGKLYIIIIYFIKILKKILLIVLLLTVLSFIYQTLGFLLQVLEELPIPMPGGLYDIETGIKPNFWLHLLIFILLLSLLMAGVWLLFRKPKRRIYFYIAVIFIVLLLVIDILRIVPKL